MNPNIIQDYVFPHYEYNRPPVSPGEIEFQKDIKGDTVLIGDFVIEDIINIHFAHQLLEGGGRDVFEWDKAQELAWRMYSKELQTKFVTGEMYRSIDESHSQYQQEDIDDMNFD